MFNILITFGVSSSNRYNKNIKMTHLQDKWKKKKRKIREGKSQPVGKAKRQAERRGDQLLEIAG
jgi:hypothetical protein